MEIVIKIDDELYERVIETVESSYDREIIANAIKNGIPLPKGHGRISDMDEAIKCIEACEGEDVIWAIALIEWACEKRTLIEADKAESEDNNDR